MGGGALNEPQMNDNPVALHPQYMPTLIRLLPALRELDSEPVSTHARRLANKTLLSSPQLLLPALRELTLSGASSASSALSSAALSRRARRGGAAESHGEEDGEVAAAAATAAVQVAAAPSQAPTASHPHMLSYALELQVKSLSLIFPKPPPPPAKHLSRLETHRGMLSAEI